MLPGNPRRYVEMFRLIAKKNAELVADWQRVGYTQGNMNRYCTHERTISTPLHLNILECSVMYCSVVQCSELYCSVRTIYTIPYSTPLYTCVL